MKSPHGNESRTTNLEKTIRDVLRSRNQIDAQFVNEAMKRYVVTLPKILTCFTVTPNSSDSRKLSGVY
jgi:hypothetical protein